MWSVEVQMNCSSLSAPEQWLSLYHRLKPEQISIKKDETKKSVERVEKKYNPHRTNWYQRNSGMIHYTVWSHDSFIGSEANIWSRFCKKNLGLRLIVSILNCWWLINLSH